MPNVTAGGDIARKWMAHYVNAAEVGSGDEKYVLLGDDLEEYNAEMSATVDKKQNILGGTKVIVSAYEKSAAVEPYYAKKGDALFERLQDIVDNARTLDEVQTEVVEVKLWEDEAADGVYPAVKENAVFEVTSYGGDTTGYQIPFTLHYTGEKTMGYFNVDSREFMLTAS